jgi:hypothetical protein
MAVCYNEIVTALGEPDREYPDNQFNWRPAVTPASYVYYVCGCRFEKRSSGSGYEQWKACQGILNEHKVW